MKLLINIITVVLSLGLVATGFAKPLSKHSVPMTMTPHSYSNYVAAAARAEAVANWSAANPGSQIGLVTKPAGATYRRNVSPALRGFRR
jgi:hypothetical protein